MRESGNGLSFETHSLMILAFVLNLGRGCLKYDSIVEHRDSS